MSKIVFIIGLPGSGKTYYGNSLDMEFFDDVDRVPVPKNRTDDFAMAHPVFCDPKALENAIIVTGEEYPDHVIERVYFENDPKQCAKNAKTRKNKQVLGYIGYLSSVYTPPLNSLPVYKGEET